MGNETIMPILKTTVILRSSPHPQYGVHCTFMPPHGGLTTVTYSLVHSELRSLNNGPVFEQHEFFKSDAKMLVTALYERIMTKRGLVEALEHNNYIVIDKRSAVAQPSGLGILMDDPDEPNDSKIDAAAIAKAMGSAAYPQSKPLTPHYTPQYEVGVDKALDKTLKALEKANTKVDDATPEQKMSKRRDDILRNMFG